MSFGERLAELGRDWDRYGQLVGRQWCDSMRRAVVLELQAEVDQMARDCGLERPVSPSRES